MKDDVKKDRNILVSVGLPADIKAKLEKKAKEDGRPLAQYIRMNLTKLCS